MSWTQQQVRELKVNRYIVIDDEPCKIIDLTTSKPGKHGAAKASIDAIAIYRGTQRSLVSPVTHTVQVVSIQGAEAQLMDLESYEMFNLDIPEEFRSDIEAGQEVSYQDAMGKRQITRV